MLNLLSKEKYNTKNIRESYSYMGYQTANGGGRLECLTIAAWVASWLGQGRNFFAR